MAAQSPREIAERFIRDGIGKADPAVFDELLAEAVVVETGLSPRGPIEGREAYKEVFFPFAEAWPVRGFVVHQFNTDCDTVVVEFTPMAVFAKDYYGVKATRQLVPMREIQRIKVEGGKIVRNTVAGVNFPFEYIMYPVLKDAVLGGLETAD